MVDVGKLHTYEVGLHWTGNRGTGTSGYRAYGRDHEVSATGKPAILGSSDPAFRGDPGRWNPEELLVAALSQCHQLAYLHLCADAGVVVLGYDDRAAGRMQETGDGGGRFAEVVLHPRVVVAEPGMVEQARALHARAHELCFIASSVSFPVRPEPEVSVHVEAAGHRAHAQ